MQRFMIAFIKNGFALLFIFFSTTTFAQQNNPEGIFQPNIRTVRFHMYGNQISMPVYKLNSGDRMELHFDDMDADVKNYYYTYQLCDYDWQPVDISPFDYIRGFTQMRITTYRYSSLAYTKYTHYSAVIPDANSLPSRSGNYILKVFLDGDTTKLAFSRRLLVVDSKSTVAAQVTVPFSPQYSRTHQRIKFTVNVSGLNSFSAGQQVKVVVMQNYRWDNAQMNVMPTFVRGSSLEYNSDENFMFHGGKEWRWLDLQSFHLRNDRIDSIEDKKTSTEIFTRPDYDRSSQKYYYYIDLNGLYNIETFENLNPYWQSDYATTHFTFVPPGRTAYPDKDVYLFGQLTDYQFNDSTKMQFNAEKGVYEATAFLKQGYYSYDYLLVNKKDPTQSILADGDYYETENNYTVLVYYKSFTDQSDELIGVATIDSRTDKPGVSF